MPAGLFEALFTLGDRPEDRYLLAQRLDARGYDDTLSYVRDGHSLDRLLPSEPGVMSWEELA